MSGDSDNTVEDRLLRVSDRLRIPTDTLQITQVRLGQLRNKPDVDESNIDDFVAAALALSAREDGLPIGEDAIASAWSETLDRDISLSRQQLETASVHLDIDEIPPHPDVLIERLGEAVEMPESLITIARRILQDAYESDPEIVAGGRSPAATAGGALSLAALVNGHDEDEVQDILGGASGTSRVAVQNRSEDLQTLLGEQLEDERYQISTVDNVERTSDDQATAADGAGTAETEQTAETSSEPDPAPAQAEPETVGVEAVESEIDALVDELDIDASTRLMARGMVGDAVGEVSVDDAAELAGATLVAGLRMQDGDLDVVDVAGQRSFEPRNVTQSLDALDAAVDVDIPRRSADDIVNELVSELGLPEAVREESRRALERYAAEGSGEGYTIAELGAGAVVFAATVNGIQVDIDDLAAISGAAPSYVSDAMNSILVSLCRSLVRGDIEYEDCSWTADLLESELSPDLGDSETGRVIAIAKAYVAGREGRHVDDATLDAFLGPE